eukprot:CAMPEP_0201565370 /NCGR_PEP_ID=MMETSP0190_2-20130828/4449_1 /ASSEMBLY_ACC=CAM_ASM_000263 /TAXON_ID=37353 /ORGANISM="Rosalina sp." /LENGTH=317 /DNA_ID=CAMNT_0047982767 /DNA_START=25 /DNA_END=978 /DNA_ORIENTATION=+
MSALLVATVLVFSIASSLNGLPEKSLGIYCLIADDTVSGYTSTAEWQPKLYDYQMNGLNVAFLTFINPTHMPAVPPAMANLAKCKGQTGCPTNDTKVIFSVGGEAYSKHAWSWLKNTSTAEAMAAEVASWDTKYGADGIDLDIEGAAGNAANAGPHLQHFADKLKELNPDFLITQPVYGYPQIGAENWMVNHGYAKNGSEWVSNGMIDSIGIMEYNDLESLQYVKDYADATNEWQGFPIHVDVPKKYILPGIQGNAGAGTIQSMANDVNSQKLGGFMVWFASVYDKTRNKPALSYGNMDASHAKSTEWAKALATMLG